MSSVLRIWVGFLALGAGLIHIACIAGSPVELAIPFAVFGAAEFVWGTLTFARSTLPVPRIALAIALLPLLGWAVLFVATGVTTLSPVLEALRPVPLAIATLFDLVLAIVIAVRLRRLRDGRLVESTGLEQRPLAFLVAVGAGALLVAALTTPALAATEAGLFATPHGSSNDGLDWGDLVHGH